jgi:hypothetical protein
MTEIQYGLVAYKMAIDEYNNNHARSLAKDLIPEMESVGAVDREHAIYCERRWFRGWFWVRDTGNGKEIASEPKT